MPQVARGSLTPRKLPAPLGATAPPAAMLPARGVRRRAEAGVRTLVVQLQVAGDLAHVLGLVAHHERDADARAPRAARAAVAVHVGVAILRCVELDHVRD